MATSGSIIANVRVQMSDTDRDWLTDAIGLEWLTQAEQEFCNHVYPLDEIADYTITAKQLRYDFPTNCIRPETVMWFDNITRKLDYCDPARWDEKWNDYTIGSGDPEEYTVVRRQVVIGPNAPSANSATAAASGAMGSSVTTLNLTAASGTFRSRGFVKVESEVMEYTGVATTTLTGVTRGVHGTNNDAHSSNATVTEVDMQMRYRKIPAALTATTASPEVPPVYQKYLEKYMLYLAWMAQGETEKAGVALQEYNNLTEQARRDIARRSKEPIRIRDRRHFFRW